MLEKGVRVALGTDGVCSNNNHDLFEEIKLAAILQKGVSNDPTLLPAWQALKLATVGGAYAQGREGECGVLAVGMDADLAVLDFNAPNLYPSHSPISALCYAARGSNVCMTLVRGKVLYERGVFTTIDMEQLRYELDSHVMPKLFGTAL
jgi:5-methylthioadenosine/S-adenosylhomocysteine deaminase